MMQIALILTDSVILNGESHVDIGDEGLVVCNETILTQNTLAGQEYIVDLVEQSKLHVATVAHWPDVIVFFSWMAMLVVSIYCRVLVKKLPFFGDRIPESVVEILLGMIVGGILKANDMMDLFTFDAHVFFVYILPPIILEAAFYSDGMAFFENMTTILLHAIGGTIFNCFLVGYSMYLVAQTMDMSSFIINEFRLIDGLLFGSVIAAVDPVAVLAVFEKQGVAARLKSIVSGESILNDGVAVVLYRVMTSVAYQQSLGEEHQMSVGVIVATAIGHFALVFIGGIVVGLIFALVAAITMKFSCPDYTNLEPMMVVVFGIMAYVVSEGFHLTGIITLMVYGLVLAQYTSHNMRKEQASSTRSILLIASHLADTIVFLTLGVQFSFSIADGWHTGFVFAAFFFTSLYRAAGVFLVGWTDNFLNRKVGTSHAPIENKDLTVMALGGLRGAIAFALAFILLEDEIICFLPTGSGVNNDPRSGFALKKLFVSSVMALIVFTVLIQGTLTGDILDYLHTDRESDADADSESSTEYKDVAKIAGFEEAFNHIRQFGQALIRPSYVVQMYHYLGFLNKDEMYQDRKDTRYKLVEAQLLHNRSQSFIEMQSVYFEKLDEFVANGLQGPELDRALEEFLHGMWYKQLKVHGDLRSFLEEKLASDQEPCSNLVNGDCEGEVQSESPSISTLISDLRNQSSYTSHSSSALPSIADPSIELPRSISFSTSEKDGSAPKPNMGVRHTEMRSQLHKVFRNFAYQNHHRANRFGKFSDHGYLQSKDFRLFLADELVVTFRAKASADTWKLRPSNSKTFAAEFKSPARRAHSSLAAVDREGEAVRDSERLLVSRGGAVLHTTEL